MENIRKMKQKKVNWNIFLTSVLANLCVLLDDIVLKIT